MWAWGELCAATPFPNAPSSLASHIGSQQTRTPPSARATKALPPLGGLSARRPAHGGIRQALYAVAVRLDEHDGHARHLADAAAQVAVAGGHDVTFVRLHALAQAVVRVRALVGAGDALEPGVLQRKEHGEDREGMQWVCEWWAMLLESHAA